MRKFFATIKREDAGGGIIPPPDPPQSDDVTGTKNGTFTTTSIVAQSSIDTIYNLNSKIVYANGISNIPLMILIHGWGGNYTSFDQATYERLANYNYLVCGIGLRMRGGNGGIEDVSAREVYDIYDAIKRAQKVYSALVNPRKTILVGYSHGGGLSLAFGSKFPDQAALIVDHFGMSDYGYSGTTSWYITDPLSDYTTGMDTYIGSPRTSKLNEYLSRETRNAIGKNLQCRLEIYHDASDAAVDVVHSDNLETQLIADGFSDYSYSRTTSSDATRWLHEYPNGTAQIINTEPLWKDYIFTHNVPTMPTSGTVLVRGYLKCSLFEIWLGDGVTESLNGTNRSALVVYDTTTDTYNVTPYFENGVTQTRVIITQGSKSINQIITTITELTVV